MHPSIQAHYEGPESIIFLSFNDLLDTASIRFKEESYAKNYFFHCHTRSIFYKKQGKNETSGVSYLSKILNGFCFLA